MTRNVWKYFAGGVGLIAVAVGVLFLTDYIKYRTSPEYRAEKYFQDLERRYREDPYGGSTPEETLQLFIDALKKGDIELASKYFSADRQSAELEGLGTIKEKSLLGQFIRDLQRLQSKYQLVEGDDSRYIFEAFNDKGELILQADVARGPSGRWKLLDL